MKKTEVWSLDGILPAYRSEPELRRYVVNAYTGIAVFMNENGLFKTRRRALDAKGKLLIRTVFVQDLTSEGLRFVKVAARSWFNAKAANHYPANTALLEKHLKAVRRNDTPIVGARPVRQAKPVVSVKTDPWDLDARLTRTRDDVMRALEERQFASALAFMRDRGLFKAKRVLDKHGRVVLRHVTARHLTPRGAKFADAAGDKWFGSKRAFLHPENVSMLQKILDGLE